MNYPLQKSQKTQTKRKLLIHTCGFERFIRRKFTKMKISKIISGILASAVAAAGSCPDMCDCTNENKVVICAFKGLTTFPDISKSPDIEDFMLVNNKITSLPRLANQLPRLRSINLSNNQLTSISRGSLPDSIEDAWLDSNLVETISRKIFSNLSNMKRVYLMNIV